MALNEKTPLNVQQPANETEKFSSHAGVVASCLGCAIGTGNIWRFPRMVALNSGRAGALCFLLPWMAFLVLWSIPMLIIEYATGRFTGKGVTISMQQLAGDKYVWCGLWIAAVNFMIGCWYHVVMGWCIFYAYRFTFHPLPVTVQDSKALFFHYTEESAWPVLTQAIGIVVTGLLLLRGVRMIERSNLIMVPFLLLLIIIVFVWSLTRDGAIDGIKFFFTPDWDTMKSPRLWIDAASQNAFDCGAGWGQFIAYAAFMTSKDPVVKFSILIPIGNNIISLICGMMTFSTAFSSLPHGYNVTGDQHIIDILQSSGPAGTGLTFVWLPVLFATAGVAGRVFAALFFWSLVVAAISSLMGTLENVVQVLENYGLPRVYSVFTIITASFLVGLGSSLNITYLTNQDFTWAFALLISGIFLQIMVVRYGITRFREHVVNDGGSGDWYVPKVWEWTIQYIAPAQAVVLLLWWVIDTIIKSVKTGYHWYAFGPTTIIPVILQWLGTLVALLLINLMLIRLKPTWFTRHSVNPSCVDAEPFGSASELSDEVDTEDVIYDKIITAESAAESQFISRLDSEDHIHETLTVGSQ